MNKEPATIKTFMDHSTNRTLQNFNDEVAIKYQLYNSLFLSLPFHKIEKTGLLLSLLAASCEEGYVSSKSPREIVDDFFQKNTTVTNDQEKTDLLFRFIQYAERQVVLFDAIEDSAYTSVNDMQGQGTLKHLANTLPFNKLPPKIQAEINQFSVRLVLTAHPTQFYPGAVLGIINDMAKELKNNNAPAINNLLKQLGKTPFIKKTKPTPYDEATSLIWYLENVFYQAIGIMINHYGNNLPFMTHYDHPTVMMGFWPGGDRDGNPFVNADTTLKVAQALKTTILKCYYRDVRQLRRRLTFRGLDNILQDLENRLNRHAYLGETDVIQKVDDIMLDLLKIKQILHTDHEGLFEEEVDNLIHSVNYFGIHFAFLDIRQENDVHTSLIKHLFDNDGDRIYQDMNEMDKMNYLSAKKLQLKGDESEDALHQDVIMSMKAMRTIQISNGELACNRYIISQCKSALNIMEVYHLLRYCAWSEENITVDVVPLFETIDDLQNAANIMEKLYTIQEYKDHLIRRNYTQTIMLGFSDGTKDGGYLMANYGIYKAKSELSEISKKHGINVLFFDGRGGPPGRGGGKTHKFYASLGNNISDSEIQLTIQGQTISSNFGTIDAARYNMEQLVSAGVSNILNSSTKASLSTKDQSLIFDLAEISLEKYLALKNHDLFMEYLTAVSPLKYFGMTNIGSRPTKRGKVDKLTLKDLRAIPFVASWNMIKQNIPGFYGLGTAFKKMDMVGRFGELQELYKRSLFFKTLIDNSEMSLVKTYLPLTQYLKNDNTYGPIWNILKEEYELSLDYILKLSGNKELMAEYPVDRLSVHMREKIVLPLTTIQQYALQQLRDDNTTEEMKKACEHLIVRSSFGIINAGRNSA